jgi:surface antigen
MKKTISAALVFVVLGLTACQTTDDWGTKQTIGTGVGAIGGGLLGSQIGHGSGKLWATGAGAVLGALVGSEIGRSLDNADKAAMANANNRANTAPLGTPISWNNPNSGNSGTVTPIRDGTNTQTGAYCREYQQTVTVGGQTQQAYGTACRGADGQWRIVQ